MEKPIVKIKLLPGAALVALAAWRQIDKFLDCLEDFANSIVENEKY